MVKKQKAKSKSVSAAEKNNSRKSIGTPQAVSKKQNTESKLIAIAEIKRNRKLSKKKRSKSMSTGEEKEKSNFVSAVSKGLIKEATPKSQISGVDVEGGSIDRIRDILFGAQMQDYERRFTRLEERLIKESANLRDDTRKRFDSLETYIKREIESLTDKLKAERTERTESIEEISRELKDLTKSFEKKIGQLDDQITKNQRDFRQQILDESKSLSDEIRQKYEETGTALERAFQELRTDKTDRIALANLFKEVAMRLTEEFKIPGSEDLGND